MDNGRRLLLPELYFEKKSVQGATANKHAALTMNEVSCVCLVCVGKDLYTNYVFKSNVRIHLSYVYIPTKYLRVSLSNN